MKLKASGERPLGTQTKTSCFIFVIVLMFVLTIIPLYFFPAYPSSSLRYAKLTDSLRLNGSAGGDMAANPPTNLSTASGSHSREKAATAKASKGKICDLYSGEWVRNGDAPYYTNATCDAIQEHQNCLKYGRPDLEFLKWRWKPDGCDLPIFDPHQFLHLVKGKSMAFVGDSVARNHMQSLICLLSRVAHPMVAGNTTAGVSSYRYTEYNFTISVFFTPFLIRTEKIDANNTRRSFNLYLDEFDETWTAKIESFDYIIISAGQWFFHPSYFYLNRTLIGCLYCSEPNVTRLTLQYSYRWAFRTALKAINDVTNFKGVAFLRTFSPSHFEGGAWDSGGDCSRTRPYKRDEIALEYYDLERYRIQLEEMGIARKAGGKLRLLDATRLLLLRPDGHPRKYGRWPVANQSFLTDCVHWCLPGPIDALNDLLQELLKREVKINNY